MWCSSCARDQIMDDEIISQYINQTLPEDLIPHRKLSKSWLDAEIYHFNTDCESLTGCFCHEEVAIQQ